ncbi:hypothetical protein N9N03_01870 [Chlamydiia bacterium]|nr:hypothetical protein [Chlamydiia bacterium]
MTNNLHLTYSLRHKNLYVNDKGISHHVDKKLQNMIERKNFTGFLGVLKRLISSIIDVKWSVKLSEDCKDLTDKINDVASKTLLNEQQHPVITDPANAEWQKMFKGRQRLFLLVSGLRRIMVTRRESTNEFRENIKDITKAKNSMVAAKVIKKYIRYRNNTHTLKPFDTYIDVIKALTEIPRGVAIAILLELKKSDPIFKTNLTTIVTNLNFIANQKKEGIIRGMELCMANGINCTLSLSQKNEQRWLTGRLSQLWRTCLLTKSLLQDGQPEKLLQGLQDNISFVAWHCLDGLSVFRNNNERELKKLAMEILREKPPSLCTANGLKIQTWLYSSKISHLIDEYNKSCVDGDLRAYHSIKTGTKYQRFWNSELQLKRWVNLFKEYSKPEKYNEKIFGELCVACDTFITNVAQNDRNTVIEYLKNNMALLNYLPQSSVIHDIIFEANREEFSISHTHKNKRVLGKISNNLDFNSDVRPKIYIGPTEAGASDMKATYEKDDDSQRQQQMDYLNRLKEHYLGLGSFGYSFNTLGHGIDDYGGGFDYFWNVIIQGLGDRRVLSEIFGNLVSIDEKNKLIINDRDYETDSIIWKNIWKNNCQFLAYILKQCIGQGITLPFEVDWHRLIFANEEVFIPLTQMQRQTISHNLDTIRQTNPNFREMYNLIQFHKHKDHLKKKLIAYGLFDKKIPGVEQEELKSAITDFLKTKKRFEQDPELIKMKQLTKEKLEEIGKKELKTRNRYLARLNLVMETWKKNNDFYEKERHIHETANKLMANITDDGYTYDDQDIINAAINCPEGFLDLIDDNIFDLVSQEAGRIIDEYIPNKSEQLIACELIWSSKNRSERPVFGIEEPVTGAVSSSFSCYDLPNAASLITLAKKATEGIDYTHLLDKLIVISTTESDDITLNNELFSFETTQTLMTENGVVQMDRRGSYQYIQKKLNEIRGNYYDFSLVDNYLAYLLNSMREKPQLIKSFLETVSSNGQIPIQGIKIKQTKANNPLPTNRTSTSNYINRYDLTRSPMKTSTCFSHIHLPPPPIGEGYVMNLNGEYYDVTDRDSWCRMIKESIILIAMQDVTDKL